MIFSLKKGEVDILLDSVNELYSQVLSHTARGWDDLKKYFESFLRKVRDHAEATPDQKQAAIEILDGVV